MKIINFFQVQAKQKISGESFGGIYENELDVQTNDTVVSLEYDTEVLRAAEFERPDNMVLTNENVVSLDYDTIMNSLLESRKDNIVKTKEKAAKRKRKKKKYNPVPRQIKSKRRNNIVKTNDRVVSLEYATRRPNNRAITNEYVTKVTSIAESKRSQNVDETNENVVSLEYDKRVRRPVKSRSKDNVVKTNDIVVSSEFDARSNELTESRRDNIVETNENRDTREPKSVKYRRGKIQQHDKSRNIEKRKPRKKMIKSADYVKRRKLFDIVVHIKA
ncbi:uncharacterized protein LOC133529770 isoform X2 [Cydia pomonella]|uniref:uncharacterized protein LOC133529770 isoform X2 n=1 Tax=Cydia pomonella TaxID=82600 RepID=UPI002ADE62BF|nr:uncharacterized protein LOC133529770 isoform X2 [Cydia pomonella]